MSQDDDHIQEEPDEIPYPTLREIDFREMSAGLCSLVLMREDVYLRMQVLNLQIVDEWTTGLEYQVLSELHKLERTPPDAHFLNAQSQMWIMALYEVLRTWRQRVTHIESLVKKGALATEIEKLKAEPDYFNAGREARIVQLEEARKMADLSDRIARDTKRLHMAFRQIEAIRMILAKHEERGRKNSIAHMPGYGRINRWCGSLDYEIAVGRIVLCNISRRDIAESMRALARNDDPPGDELLASFDQFMSGSPRFQCNK